MRTNFCESKLENYIESKDNTFFVDKDVTRLTGSLRAGQVFSAIRYDFRTHVWRHHKKEVIANNGWFYIRREILTNICEISENAISQYVRLLVKHGLLETKVTNQGYRKGTTTFYRFSETVLKAGGNSLANKKTENAGENSSPAQNTTDLQCNSNPSSKSAGEEFSPALIPDPLTKNLDTPLIDKSSSRAREKTYVYKNIISGENTYGCASASHCTSSPKKSQSSGVLLSVPNYSKNDMKCAQFCFDTICKNFPKSNAAKAGWDSLRDEWSVTIDKLAKKFTDGDNKRVQAALKWAFGPRNRRNSFLQENIRSLPMLLTKKWKTSDEMEFTFYRLLREFDADTQIDTEDSLDAKLRTACDKALAKCDNSEYNADDVMEWVEYLQNEIDRLSKLLPPDKRSMWHRRESMAKVIPWITELIVYFSGCSMYPNLDKYVDRFLEITENKIRSGKLKYLWPGYFSTNGDDYAAFEQHITELYPDIFN